MSGWAKHREHWGNYTHPQPAGFRQPHMVGCENEVQPGVFLDDGCHPMCSCGWCGNVCSSEADANAELQDHYKAVAKKS